MLACFEDFSKEEDKVFLYETKNYIMDQYPKSREFNFRKAYSPKPEIMKLIKNDLKKTYTKDDYPGKLASRFNRLFKLAIKFKETYRGQRIAKYLLKEFKKKEFLNDY